MLSYQVISTIVRSYSGGEMTCIQSFVGLTAEMRHSQRQTPFSYNLINISPHIFTIVSFGCNYFLIKLILKEISFIYDAPGCTIIKL